MTNLTLFWWLAPVLIGLWVSIPVSVWTSRLDIGLNAKREKLFLTPEETSPLLEVVQATTPTKEQDNRRYRGEFKDDLYHGRGVYTDTDGSVYDGELRAGRFGARL